MPRVICDRPNASEEISGVKFSPLAEGGMISEEISDERAALFLEIEGYSLDEEERAPAVEVKPAPTTRKAGKKAAAAEPVAPVEEPVVPAEEPAAEPSADETVF